MLLFKFLLVRTEDLPTRVTLVVFVICLVVVVIRVVFVISLVLVVISGIPP